MPRKKGKEAEVLDEYEEAIEGVGDAVEVAEYVPPSPAYDPFLRKPGMVLLSKGTSQRAVAQAAAIAVVDTAGEAPAPAPSQGKKLLVLGKGGLKTGVPAEAISGAAADVKVFKPAWGKKQEEQAAATPPPEEPKPVEEQPKPKPAPWSARRSDQRPSELVVKPDDFPALGTEPPKKKKGDVSSPSPSPSAAAQPERPAALSGLRAMLAEAKASRTTTETVDEKPKPTSDERPAKSPTASSSPLPGDESIPHAAPESDLEGKVAALEVDDKRKPEISPSGEDGGDWRKSRGDTTVQDWMSSGAAQVSSASTASPVRKDDWRRRDDTPNEGRKDDWRKETGAAGGGAGDWRSRETGTDWRSQRETSAPPPVEESSSESRRDTGAGDWRSREGAGDWRSSRGGSQREISSSNMPPSEEKWRRDAPPVARESDWRRDRTASPPKSDWRREGGPQRDEAAPAVEERRNDWKREAAPARESDWGRERTRSPPKSDWRSSARDAPPSRREGAPRDASSDGRKDDRESDWRRGDRAGTERAAAVGTAPAPSSGTGAWQRSDKKW